MQNKEVTMKIFYTNEFEGVWPTGTAAIIVAKDEKAAKLLFEAEAQRQGLTGKQSDGSDINLKELGLKNEQAIILNNGGY